MASAESAYQNALAKYASVTKSTNDKATQARAKAELDAASAALAASRQPKQPAKKPTGNFLKDMFGL